MPFTANETCAAVALDIGKYRPVSVLLPKVYAGAAVVPFAVAVNFAELPAVADAAAVVCVVPSPNVKAPPEAVMVNPAAFAVPVAVSVFVLTAVAESAPVSVVLPVTDNEPGIVMPDDVAVNASVALTLKPATAALALAVLRYRPVSVLAENARLGNAVVPFALA